METKPTLQHRIDNAPEEIRKQASLVLNLTDAKAQLEDDIKRMELAMKTQVANDSTRTNDHQRKVALTTLKKEDALYLSTLENKATTTKELSIAELDLAFLRDRFKADLAMFTAGYGDL